MRDIRYLIGMMADIYNGQYEQWLIELMADTPSLDCIDIWDIVIYLHWWIEYLRRIFFMIHATQHNITGQKILKDAKEDKMADWHCGWEAQWSIGTMADTPTLDCIEIWDIVIYLHWWIKYLRRIFFMIHAAQHNITGQKNLKRCKSSPDGWLASCLIGTKANRKIGTIADTLCRNLVNLESLL